MEINNWVKNKKNIITLWYFYIKVVGANKVIRILNWIIKRGNIKIEEKKWKFKN